MCPASVAAANIMDVVSKHNGDEENVMLLTETTQSRESIG
jgi:hypothetical protein